LALKFVYRQTLEIIIDLTNVSFMNRNPVEGYDFKTNTGKPYNYFSYGVSCTEVEIDTLTGEHQVN